MKVSSLSKDETLKLLDLYKQLEQIEEDLDSYISNTAAPEVSNIKKAQEIKNKSDEEATEILNSSLQTKDTKKMISLLEEYIDSSNEIESSSEKSRQIMQVIEELSDRKKSIEEDIKLLESSEKEEKLYDKIEKILSKKCKIINCDKKFNKNIVSDYQKFSKVVLINKQDNVTEELIRIVENHMTDKTKEAEEKLKIVNVVNEVKKDDIAELPIQKIIDLDNKILTEEKIDNQSMNVINIDSPVIEDTNQINEEESIIDTIVEDETNNENEEESILEEETVSNIDNEDESNILVNEVKEENDNYVPISDILNQDTNASVSSINDILDRQLEELNQDVKTEENNEKVIAEQDLPDKQSEEINDNIKYVDNDIQNKKIVKVLPQKKENVSNIWDGYTTVKIKKLEVSNNEEIKNDSKSNISTNTNNNINFDSFVTGKAA